MNEEQMKELLLQSLEHERGGIQVYETAVKCALRDELRKEWKGYLEQTRQHERILRELCTALELDAEEETPGRQVVRSLGQSLVAAMKQALGEGAPEAAQIVACECVVLAETKDHADWQLIGALALALGDDERGAALKQAYDQVEDQEDEHLYHTKGWCRELWIESLGLGAVLPPPEETRKVRTAIGAARAEQAAELARLAGETG